MVIDNYDSLCNKGDNPRAEYCRIEYYNLSLIQHATFFTGLLSVIRGEVTVTAAPKKRSGETVSRDEWGYGGNSRVPH